jgi:hypothetical protein
MLIERAACRFAAAESIAVPLQDDPRLRAEIPGRVAGVVASIQYARGALQAASASVARSSALARAGSDAVQAEFAARYGVQLACMSGEAYPLPPDAWVRDTSVAGWVSRGLRATCVEDLPVARRCLGAVQARPARNLVWQGAGPALLEARVAMLRNQPLVAERILRPLSQQRVEMGLPPVGVGLAWVRWTLADAFERTGRPDSAAVHLERNLTIPIIEPEFHPVTHHRLVMLYARMGRAADAERHLVALEQAWDRPDPAIRRMLDEARAAVRAARGMNPTEPPHKG